MTISQVQENISYVIFTGINPDKKINNLSGIEVLLLDMNDRILNYTNTNSKGFYVFTNLAYGTYKVFVEIWGLYSTTAIVTIGPDNPAANDISFNIDLSNNPISINASINNITASGYPEIGDIYPNPMSDIANITLVLPMPENIKISIYNSIGRLMSVKQFNAVSGMQTILLETSSLSDGLYEAVIAIKDKTSYLRKFIKTAE